MPKYNSFLTLFIISVIAFIVFMLFYLKGMIAFISHDFYDHHTDQNPFAMFRTIFSPPVIISFVIMLLSGLATRIIGIVCVVKNKTVSDGEKAIWVIGFFIMGFVTAIVFLIMAKGKKFVE